MNFAKSVGASEAARRLGLTPQAVRDRIRLGTLPGHKNERGQWRVPEAALPAAANEPAATLAKRVAALEREVEVLRTARGEHDGLLAAIAADRDRHRADAIAAREAALQLNVTIAELRASVRSLLNALDGQAHALTQMLAPGSPEELS